VVPSGPSAPGEDAPAEAAAPAIGGHVILIGLRGAGKSTVGRLLSERWRCPFHDLDELALRRLGSDSVREVFEHRGEATWRQAEAEALDAFLEAPLTPSVLALGGGSVMIDRVACSLAHAKAQAGATVVLLDVSPSAAAQRLVADPGDRPSLTGAGVADELTALHAARIDRYRSLASVIVPSSSGSAHEIARAIDAIRTGS
jgi:shikimate kinase